jgi:hypothetical protein
VHFGPHLHGSSNLAIKYYYYIVLQGVDLNIVLQWRCRYSMGRCQLPERHERGESGRGGRRRADLECEQSASPSTVVVRAAHRRCGPAPWASSTRGQHRASGSALRTLLLVCAFARGADGSRVHAQGGSGAMSSSAARGVAVLLWASLAALQPRAALGATPLFSTYFPSESCCKKPNFLNENIAPELTRCRQVGVSRVRGGMRTSFSLAPESAYGRPLYIEHPRAQIISDTYGYLVIISYYHRTRGRILFLDPLCVCVFMGM